MGTPSTVPTLVHDVQALHPSNHQSVAYTAVAGTIATAIRSSIVRVVCTSQAFVAVGPNPTATTSDVYFPTDAVEYFHLNPGDKVSAIQLTAGGTLHVTEMD